MPRQKNDPFARVVYTPLPNKAAKGSGRASSGAAATKASRQQNESPYLRAANEDDDGYDPYSDRREEPPLFEANPWD